MSETKLTGLTAAEVAQRVQQGLVNRTPRRDWLDYLHIVGRNLFTWFNAMVTPAALGLFLLGDLYGAMAVSGMAVVNSAIGLFQEIRAKRHLDKLAILVETRARVLRDGATQEILASDVVQGDHISLSSGEAVVADGPVLEAQFLEVDEALLTGESDPVRRQPGDALLSGSFCVAGEGMYRADKVGGQAFAHMTSTQARSYHFTTSPMTRVINRIIQILTYTAVGLCLLYLGSYIYQGFPHDRKLEYVQMVAATITSMVPQGLVLTATLAFTLGAMVMSRKGAVIQRLHAVETMAAIDVICTDKTGTLTTNRLKLDQVCCVDPAVPEEQVRDRLRSFACASIDKQNKNIQAIRAALGEARVEVIDQIPFKSQNRYSAVRLRDGDGESVLVMGAPEALRERISLWEQTSQTDGAAWQGKLEELRKTGLRVLLLAEAAESGGKFSTGELSDRQVGNLPPQLALPEVPLRPLALVCLSDELRPEAGQVLEALHAQGIAFKVISGDNPETVRATVAHLNLPLAREPVVSGDELARAANKVELIRERSVFGRVSPEQKVEIVETLRAQGCHVAMIGDGVNDVLPIKRADLGIAMGEGSQASKTVSSLVLENNNFALLPETLEEGRTIVRNLRRSGKLFLVKNVYSLILILAYYVGVLGLPFPYVPQQVTLLNWLVIGIPAFVIALSRERSRAATKPHFLREVGWFALRSGVVFGMAGVAMLLLADRLHPDDAKIQRAMLLSTLVLLGITALFRALRDGESQALVGDTRFRYVGIAAIPTYLVAMYWPLTMRFFDLAPLAVLDWVWVLGVAGCGYGLTLLADLWRGK